MKIVASVMCALTVLVTNPVSAADGLITMKSSFDAKETMDRMEKTLRDKGMTIFERIDHAAGAEKIGKALRPTEVLLFGNPKAGTPFIECAQTVGIDLPMKTLVWKDASGQVWLGYNDPAFLTKRHGAPECGVVGGMSKTLDGLAREALRQVKDSAT